MITQENIQQLNLDVNLIHLLKQLYNNHCIVEVLHLDGKVAGYHLAHKAVLEINFVATLSKDQFYILLENRLIIERKDLCNDSRNIYGIRYTGAQVLSRLGEIGGNYEIPTELQ
jgi:hypothetical protein